MGLCASKPDRPVDGLGDLNDLGDLGWTGDNGSHGSHGSHGWQAEPGNGSCGGSSSERAITSADTQWKLHADLVNAVSAGASASQVLSGSEDGSCVLYDWRHGEEVKRWAGHDRGINAVLFGPRRTCAFTASRDLTICQWSVEQRESVQSFSGHTLTVSALTLSPDETVLCSGGRDSTVRLWDVASGRQIAQNATPRNLVTSLKWVPGEPCILQGSEDLRMRVWDTRAANGAGSTLKVEKLYAGHSNIPLAVDVSLDGQSFLSCHKGFDSVGCELRVWDRRQTEARQLLHGHTQAVNSCAFLPHCGSGRGGSAAFAASAGKDKTLRVWALGGGEQGECVATHYFATAVLDMAVLAQPASDLYGSRAGGDEGADPVVLEINGVGNDDGVDRLALGCTDGSLHVLEVRNQGGRGVEIVHLMQTAPSG